MTRKIKVISTLGVSGTIETNVTTSAELKPLLNQRNIDYAGMKLVVGETRNEITLDEAVLPTGDFKLYLMPMKTKSGGMEEIASLINILSTALENLVEKFEELETPYDIPVKSVSVEDDQDLRDLQSLLNG